MQRFVTRIWALLESTRVLAQVAAISEGRDPEGGLPKHHDVERPEASKQTFQDAGWLWDLVRLAEELEHVSAWGATSPGGSTRWRNRSLEDVRARIQEMALDLAFYSKILECAAAMVPETPLMGRLREEISRAMEGPGYRFRPFRVELLAQARASHEDAHRPDTERNESDSPDEASGDGFYRTRVYGDGGMATRGEMLLKLLGAELGIDDRFRVAGWVKSEVELLVEPAGNGVIGVGWIAFFGERRDAREVPTPYHHYIIHAVAMPTGDAVATALAVTESPRIQPVVAGSIFTAIKSMKEDLRALHPGLSVQTDV